MHTREYFCLNLQFLPKKLKGCRCHRSPESCPLKQKGLLKKTHAVQGGVDALPARGPCEGGAGGSQLGRQLKQTPSVDRRLGFCLLSPKKAHLHTASQPVQILLLAEGLGAKET